MLVEHNDFDFEFESIELSIYSIFGHDIWWLKINLIFKISSCGWQYASC
jgi:hypothetical protein